MAGQSRRFGTELWESYCDVTHFHGFHEMEMFKNPWNRCFWILSIIGGFALSLYLIIIGCQNYLQNPVATLVTINRTGDVELTFLYCPAEWIDESKLEQYNVTEIELFYALSHLRGATSSIKSYPGVIYAHEYNSHEDYGAFITQHFCEFLYDVIEKYITGDNRILPQYYSDSAGKVLRNFRLAFPCYDGNINVNKDLYLIVFEFYTANLSKDLFTLLYENFILHQSDLEGIMQSTGAYRSLGLYNESVEPDVEESVEFLRLSELLSNRVSQPGFDCFTLKVLDQLERYAVDDPNIPLNDTLLQLTNCTDVRLTSFNFKKHYSNRRHWIEYVFSLLFDLVDSYDPRFLYPAFESYRNKNVLEKTRVNKNFKEYLEANLASNGSPHVLMDGLDTRQLLGEYIESSNMSTNDFAQLISEAAEAFINSESSRYEEFLRQHGFNNSLELLTNLSIDANRFIVWADRFEVLTADGMSGSWKLVSLLDTGANIIAIKLMTGRGVCFQFHILVRKQPQLDMERFPTVGKLTVGDIRSLEQFYVDIIPLQNKTSRFKDSIYQRAETFLVFGESAKDLNPGIYLKESNNDNKVLKVENNTRYTLNITNLETLIRVDRYGSRCSYSEEGEKYTYSNCLLTCDGYFTQPRLQTPTTLSPSSATYTNRTLAWCYYPLDNLPSMLPKPPAYSECSFFTLMNATLKRSRGLYKATYNFSLSTLTGGYMTLSGEELTYFSYNSSEGRVLKRWYEEELSTIERGNERIECIKACKQACTTQDLTLEVSSENFVGTKPEPHCTNLSMEEYTKELERFNSLNVPNKLLIRNSAYTLCTLPFDVGHTFRLIIYTRNITYEEQLTYTWDSLFGIVGGQIGLVTGASCLTFVQLLWVLVKTMYVGRHQVNSKEKTKPRRQSALRNQGTQAHASANATSTLSGVGNSAVIGIYQLPVATQP